MNNRVGFQARLQQGRVVLGGALAMVLAACGGGDDTTTTQVPNSFIYATQVLGHDDYVTFTPNQLDGSHTVGASAQTVSNPTGGVAIAADGSVMYIADTNNHRILGFKSIPTKAGQAADFIIGQAQPDQTAPGTTQGTFSYPGKVSISDDGRLVVADTGNNRVLIWNSLPTSNVPADVVIGQTDFTDGSPNQGLLAPTAQTLSNPTAATIAKNQLFVIDNNNNRMLIWNLTTSPLPTTSGTPYNTDATVVWGQPSPTTNTPNCGLGTFDTNLPTPANDCSLGNYPISQNSLNQPQDLWTDGTKLFVADTANNRVLIWSQIPIFNTYVPALVLGQGTFTSGVSGGTSQTGLSAPYSVASDGSRVFVADTGNNRVMVYDNFPAQSGQGADTVIGQNYWTYKTANDDNQDQQQDNNPSGRTLKVPTGVFAIGGANPAVFVTDFGNNRILQFEPQ